VAAAGSAALPHRSKWHIVHVGPVKLAGRQGLMSWKRKEGVMDLTIRSVFSLTIHVFGIL